MGISHKKVITTCRVLVLASACTGGGNEYEADGDDDGGNGAVVWAAENGEVQRKVTVCAQIGTAGSMAYAAEVLASRMFAEIDVHIDWRAANSCAGFGNALTVSISDNTPANQLPGALAYALPYEGTKGQVDGSMVPMSLAHVLVHEITHILQRVGRHSASGVMKARFNETDHAKMKGKGLGFTKEDIDLIHIGLDWRQARLAENTLVASR
jgi:hypothetical protein